MLVHKHTWTLLINHFSFLCNSLEGMNWNLRPWTKARNVKCFMIQTSSVDCEYIKYCLKHKRGAVSCISICICRPNSTCSRGECLQMYRHHWMLVWDERLSTWPPVTFLPVEVPSHCQCVNVGRAAKRRRKRG